jgi:uncharacterized membrane protein
MTATPDAAEKALGKARIEALSDGVFAIVMTLLSTISAFITSSTSTAAWR